MSSIRTETSRLPPTQVAYFAGLFDGEGCVGVYHQPKQRSSCLRVQLVQNEKPGVVESFNQLTEAFGGKIRYQKTRTENIKVCYDAAGDPACCFLKTILPFVRWKLEQVVLGIAWHEQRPPRRRDFHGRVVSRQQDEIDFARIVSEISRELKAATLEHVGQSQADWAAAIKSLGLREVLACHQNPIRVLCVQTSIHTMMTGEDIKDPYQD